MMLISSGLVKSIWFQFGTDLKLLDSEVSHIKKSDKFNQLNIFGSLLIPSKQFIARFKFRPWKEVYIAEKYINSLEKFYGFSKDLINFYRYNNIIPVVETDFSSLEKLETIKSLFKN